MPRRQVSTINSNKMSKKTLRKELELILIKTIEEVLNKRDVEATKKIGKTMHEATKMIAKKFLKTMNPLVKNKIVAPKKVIKSPLVPIKKVVSPTHKKSLQK